VGAVGVVGDFLFCSYEDLLSGESVMM